MRSDRQRLINHAIALLLVAAAVGVRAAFAPADGPSAFLLSSVAIAASAWIGGASAGLTATLAALLAGRVLSHVDFITSVLFVAESLLIVWLTTRALHAVGRSADAVASANARIDDLLHVQSRLRRLEAAASQLEQVAVECAAIVVDDRGRVVEWRSGAARLFGASAEAMQGRPAGQLFDAGEGDAFASRLAAVPRDVPWRSTQQCRRADGTAFDADVEIHRVVDAAASPSFILVVRDRTREQEWRVFADQSSDAQTTLREEAEAARRQLATLQYITDPALNFLPSSQAVTALLDRLRDAIEADGVAVIRNGRPRRRMLTATDGLKPDIAAERRPVEGRTPQAGRILIVQNDPARVDAASAAGWCEEASSLIAVPIVSGSHIEGTIEAVRIKARGATEWEIALVQVVAAQLAGRLQNDTMFGADAVA